MKSRFSRRNFLKTGTSAVLATVLGSGLLSGLAQAGEEKTVRIGFQKSSTLITLLKSQGTLEKKLAPLGYKVSWHEFTSGLPLLESLNVGNIDFSADVADTVPVFALAAGADVVFVAKEAPSPTAQAIVVPANSPIKTVADLKGKRVGFAKAAGVHYLLLSALEKNGLNFKDITPAYLSPADGRAAFTQGSIDAWVVWDPFVSAVQSQSDVRVLSDGSNGLASYQRFYLASSKFSKANPRVVNLIYGELQDAGKWVKKNPKEAAAILAPAWGLDTATVETANSRRSYAVQPVDKASLQDAQQIADVFFKEGLLPKAVNVLGASAWRPVR